jgi:hypothetical protein
LINGFIGAGKRFDPIPHKYLSFSDKRLKGASRKELREVKPYLEDSFRREKLLQTWKEEPVI